MEFFNLLSGAYSYPYAILFLWATWYMYVLVMGLYRAHLTKRLSPTQLVLAAPALLVGYAMDILCNLTVACLIFRDIPREWLVTDRLERYKQGDGWRQEWADWICTNLLDPFDPSGDHC